MNSRVLLLAGLFVLSMHVVSGEEFIFDSSLYTVSDLVVDIDLSNTVDLYGDVSTLTNTLYYYPHDLPGQTILNEDTSPRASEENNAYVYRYENPSGQIDFTYDARVRSQFNRPEIRQKVAFPYEYVPPAAQRYLNSEEIIRITPEIRALASELVGSEDDALRAIFEIGRWVKDNIEYDLNTVTAEASQPSDWVLDQRRGVCDELTSLFIAMLRSQGVPARFVSGVAYTNLETLDSPWGPHGWAEVWVPGHGWVPYDVTYGQFGYVDATHISFMISEDARTNAVEYLMQSRNGDLQPGELNREVTLVDRGQQLPDSVRISIEPAIDEVGFGGYNRLDVTVENLEDYYVGMELFLAKTTDLTTDDYTRSIFLGPNEKRSVHWIIQTDDDLRSGFRYTFPVLVYTNKNTSHTTTFVARDSALVVGREELEVPQSIREESLPGIIECEAPRRVARGEQFTVTCSYPEEVELCISGCSVGTTREEPFTFDEVGARSFLVTAQRAGKSTERVITVIVEDEPELTLTAEFPETIAYGELETLRVRLNRTSIANVHDVTLTLDHTLFSDSWDFETIDTPGVVEILINGNQLTSGENIITLTATYPSLEETITETIQVSVTPIPATFGERLQLWLNTVTGWLI